MQKPTVDELLAGSRRGYAPSTPTKDALDRIVADTRVSSQVRSGNRRRRGFWLIPGAVLAVGALTAGTVVSLAARGGRLARWPVWPALVGLIAIAPLSGPISTPLAWLVVTYAVVAVGSRTNRATGVVRHAGDPSYGMYLWGFPVQQVFIVIFGVQPVAINVAAVLPLTMALGYASWWLIERPAIARGIRHGHSKPHAVNRGLSPRR